MLFDLATYRRHPAPFPAILQRGALDEAFCQQLIDEFPSDDEARGFRNIMGGRRRLSSDEEAFYRFVETRPAWKKLYDEVNSHAFVAQIMAVFRDDIARWGGRGEMPWEFDPEKLRRTCARGNSIFRRIARRLDLVDDFHDPIPAPAGKHRIHVHFDISAAYDGYWREAHHDLDKRIAAFLIYFSDADETGGSGGEFGIHRLKDGGASGFPKAPPEANLETVELLRPEKNLMLMFLSTPNSYHSVPEIAGSHAARKFIYVGISIEEESFWDHSRIDPALIGTPAEAA